MNRISILFLMCLVFFSCEFKEVSPADSLANNFWEAKIGNVVKGCIEIDNSSLANGTAVYISSFSEHTSLHKVEITGECQLPNSDFAYFGSSDRQVLTYYSLSGEQIDGIGFMTNQIPKIVNSVLSVDFDGDKLPETFRECASNEGLHRTVWSGAPLTGKRRWHAYRYLGYDVESDCDPKDW